MIQLTVSRTITKTITTCNACPYFIAANPEEAFCEHPDMKKLANPYDALIGYPESREGFPDKCPLIKNITKTEEF